MMFDIPTAAQIAGLVVGTVGALTFIGVAAHYIVERTNAKVAAAPEPRISDDRFQRLEQAVDAIAIEVERISEAQRFTAKLLAERSKDSVLPS
jgi:hypothetical protein